MDSRLRGSKSGEGEGIREGRATTRVAPTRERVVISIAQIAKNGCPYG